ncbi:biotin/lipoyl-containing protein, partial [Nevskia soli]|uniref:biotin/lipoyl-containing protein n=1 Tax=Nevskia soli TaxID=418856 RepID=UPI0004A70995
MAKELEVKVPDIGNYDGVPVIDVLVKVGDQVEKETSLVTLESDKATMDVPAPEAGVIKSIKLKVGDKVSQGDAVLVLELAGEAEAAPKAGAPAEAEQPAPKKEAPKAEKAPEKAPAAPAKAVAPSKLAVTIPDVGNYDHIPVIEVFVKDGDVVEKDAPLLTLESDKATMDVPAPAAGIVSGLKVKVGDKLSQGDAVCTLEVSGGGEAEPAAAAEENKPTPEKKAEAAPAASAPVPAPAAPASSDAIPY